MSIAQEAIIQIIEYNGFGVIRTSGRKKKLSQQLMVIFIKKRMMIHCRMLLLNIDTEFKGTIKYIIRWYVWEANLYR